METVTKPKKWGNSIGVIIPFEVLKEQGLSKGDRINIDIVAKKRMDGFGVCRGAESFTEEEEVHQEF